MKNSNNQAYIRPSIVHFLAALLITGSAQANQESAREKCEKKSQPIFAFGPYRDQCMDNAFRRSVDLNLDSVLTDELEFDGFLHEGKLWKARVPKNISVESVQFQKVYFTLILGLKSSHAQVRFKLNSPIALSRPDSPVLYVYDVVVSPESVKTSDDAPISFFGRKGIYGTAIRIQSSNQSYDENVSKYKLLVRQYNIDFTTAAVKKDLLLEYFFMSSRLSYEKPFIHYEDNCQTNTLLGINRVAIRNNIVTNPDHVAVDFFPDFGMGYLKERNLCSQGCLETAIFSEDVPGKISSKKRISSMDKTDPSRVVALKLFEDIRNHKGFSLHHLLNSKIQFAVPLKGYSGKTETKNCEISFLQYVPAKNASRSQIMLQVRGMKNAKDSSITLSQVDSPNRTDARGQVFEAINLGNNQQLRVLLTIENLSQLSTRLVFGIEDIEKETAELCHIEI